MKRKKQRSAQKELAKIPSDTPRTEKNLREARERPACPPAAYHCLWVPRVFSPDPHSMWKSEFPSVGPHLPTRYRGHVGCPIRRTRTVCRETKTLSLCFVWLLVAICAQPCLWWAYLETAQRETRCSFRTFPLPRRTTLLPPAVGVVFPVQTEEETVANSPFPTCEGPQMEHTTFLL